ncbi:mediator of RNA polymerase II transcription subunit 13 [Mortierella sp. GBA30]|nr:mediator of RNA polymerase II transcription subunit 13 [Mortierella sp. GBA30]
MLHDNFPTNLFSISELSTFGYTRYAYSCSRRQFARQLNADGPSRAGQRSHTTSDHSKDNDGTHDYASGAPPAESDPLLAAYISLLTARIPCHWRYSEQERVESNSRSKHKTLERELWVFWLADQSLLQNHGLEKLKEYQSGLLAWDTILQNNTPGLVGTPQTPKPGTTSTASAASPSSLFNANQEYQFFICGLRNVLDRGMVARGGYRLGDAYVFPASLQPRLAEFVLPSFPAMPSILILQPTFQHHRLRLLNTMDLDARSYSAGTQLQVILSPHGTPAILKLRDMSEFTEEQTQRCLDDWANLFGTNHKLANDMALSLPRLVAVSVRSGVNEVVLQYPTERVFVPVPCKDSPSDVGQLDGMGSRSLGFIEDLGAKFALWSWQEKTRNTIASPAVPKLVQAVSDHVPVLAEPRNRLKAGSSAWQQQQQQQQQQASFMQQQHDALTKRINDAASYDTNRIDYWSYSDPYAYLTSIVLNSCANVEPKGPDSPSAADSNNQTSAIMLTPKPPISKSRLKGTAMPATSSAEADGWIRKAPRSVQNMHSYDSTDPENSNHVWGNDSVSMQTSDVGSSFGHPAEFVSSVKASSASMDSRNANASMSSSSYQLPSDLPVENSDMMSGLMDMNSMLGLYGAGNSDDLDDWGEVTKDDFSYFDEQPRVIAPVRSLPIPASVSFDPQPVPSSIPITSTLTGAAHPTSAPPSTNGVMSAFPEPPDPFSKMMTMSSPTNDDNLFANMDLDMTAFTTTSSEGANTVSIIPVDIGDKSIETNASSAALCLSPCGDHFVVAQLQQANGVPTPAPQDSMPERDQSHLSHDSPSHLLQPYTSQTLLQSSLESLSSLTKTPPIFIRHLHSPIQSFIPSSFSPLKVVGGLFVDESKYQAGGRYAYRRLNKRRKSSIRDLQLLSRKESRMLPFYQPGKNKEWVMPVRKGMSRKLAAQQPSLGFNWSAIKEGRSRRRFATISLPRLRETEDKTDSLSGRSKSVPSISAWGISSLSLNTPSKKKNKGVDSSSGTDSDSSTSALSTSDSENDSSSSTCTAKPISGKISSRSLSNAEDTDMAGPWSIQGLNSAKLAASFWTAPKDQGIGGNLVDIDVKAIRYTVPDTDHGFNARAWPTAEAYHAEVEFDTPFTPAILSSAPPALVEEPLTVPESLASEYFLEAVKVLCEQAVLGEYPFSGSNEVTGTSGEVSEGESFHVMLARRKIMDQFLRGGVTTVPALADESFRNLVEMKSILFELLDRLRRNPSENAVALPVPSEASQEMTLSMGSLHGHHHHSTQSSVVPPVFMKGPLTLLQYLSLAETQQMPSKYGKYQVKKKKPTEPALMLLPPPDIVVGHNEEWLEAAPTILRFWEKLSLEPYSNKKNIVYFVVYPQAADIETSVSKFWRELSVIFEASLLGRHQPGTVRDYKPGLVPIPLLPALAGEVMEARQVRSYVDGCQRLGSILGGVSLRRDVHTVIYMVNPFSHGAGYFDLCRCFSIMKTQFRTAALGSLLSPLEQQRERLVLQIVPIQHVLYPSTFGGYLRFGLKDIAFTVYSKCKMFLERPIYSPGLMAQVNTYAPPFALARTTPVSIQYDVGQKPNSVPKPVATLHVGYGFSLDGRWLVCVWTDHRGEMLEHMALDMTNSTNRVLVTTTSSDGNNDYNDSNNTKNHDNGDTGVSSDQLLLRSLEEIWARTLIYQKRGSFTWKTVVCKLNLMTRRELQEWIRLTKGADQTAIVSINLDSPLRIYPHSRGSEYLTSGLTPSASSINTPTASGTGPGNVQGTGLGLGTPLLGSTPLAQSLVSNSASTPDGSSTGPATPTTGNNGGLNSAGVTGLGIAGTSTAAGTSFVGVNNNNPHATSAGGPGGMGGIGGLSGNETLENSAGQVYAMVLNHRMPLIVSRQEAGFGVITAFDKRQFMQSRGQTMSRAQAEQTRRMDRTEEMKGESSLQEDIKMEDCNLSALMTNSSHDKDVDKDDVKHPDQDMEFNSRYDISSQSHLKEDHKYKMASSSSPLRYRATEGSRDVILPLSTGYLIQVPVQSNSVMREKHSLESLGVEVHLLHLQRKSTANFSTSSGTASTPTAGPLTVSGFAQQSVHESPYQQHSTAYQLQRHHPASPSTPGYQPYRPSSSGSNSQYSGSSPSISSPSAFLPNQNQAGTSVGINAGSTSTTKSTIAATMTREILKQFHAMSYLSISAAPAQTNCLPNHMVLVERLSRVLLLVQE